MKQLRTKQMPKTTPGYRVAVCKRNHSVKRKHLTHQPDVPLERVHPWDKTHVEEVSLLLQDKDTELGRILDNPLCSSTCSDVAFSVQLQGLNPQQMCSTARLCPATTNMWSLSTDLAISKPG